MARPAIQALAEQQKLIDRLASANESLIAHARRQHGVIQAQGRRIQQHEQVFTAQRNQISSLGRGLQAIAEAAGIGDHVKTAMRKRADEQNPAQPVPEPPAQPPVQTTQEADMPEAFADPMAPGLVPGTTNDVAADSTTTAYTPGTDIEGPALKNLQDVTAPVDGTQGPLPTDQVRTLTDVRVGDPMNPAPAYPLRGDFANAQRLGSKEAASNRTMASLRLARARLATQAASHDNDFEEAAAIEKDAAMSDEKISAEIQAREGIVQTSARARPAGLVPRAASNGHRTTPSMQTTAGSGSAGTGEADAAVADADLFME